MNARTEAKAGELVDMTEPKSQELAQTESGGMLAIIERMATDDRVDPDKLMKMLEVRERWENREAEKSFNQDFIALQNDLPEIDEGGKIIHKGNLISKYARWDEDINPVIKPILAKHGFTLSFETNTKDGIHVTAHLIHREGHSRSGSFSLPPDTSGAKNQVQAIGSSTAYAKRYAAGPLLNLTTRGLDDDGVKACAPETITDKQIAQLREELEASDRKEADYLRFAKLNSLDELPAKNFGAAVRDIRAAGRRK